MPVFLPNQGPGPLKTRFYNCTVTRRKISGRTRGSAKAHKNSHVSWTVFNLLFVTPPNILTLSGPSTSIDFRPLRMRAPVTDSIDGQLHDSEQVQLVYLVLLLLKTLTAVF